MKQFQPNGRCGNCQFYRRSKVIQKGTFTKTEPAECGKNCNPKTCDEFKPRGKKSKRMGKRIKKWERGFTYDQEAK